MSKSTEIETEIAIAAKELAAYWRVIPADTTPEQLAAVVPAGEDLLLLFELDADVHVVEPATWSGSEWLDQRGQPTWLLDPVGWMPAPGHYRDAVVPRYGSQGRSPAVPQPQEVA